jgi:hypothetical protein
MSYNRLIVELDDERWVTFRRAHTPPGDQSPAEFQLPKGFSLGDVLEAARATGWVVDRQGTAWIDHQTGCSYLANFVLEMICYFDAPNLPSKRLLRIQEAVDCRLGEESEVKVHFSPWVYAWLDLVIRDDAKEEVLTADDVWGGDFLKVDVATLRDRRLRQVLERFQPQAMPAEAAEPAEGGRMAPSERTRRTAGEQRKDVG